MASPRKVRVLVVDDSQFVRDAITFGLSKDTDIEVVGTARNTDEAERLIVELKPDVVTLDISMPGKDGLQFLREQMKRAPIPIVIVSALAQTRTNPESEALAAGAAGVIGKTAKGMTDGFDGIVRRLRVKLKSAASQPEQARPKPEIFRPSLARHTSHTDERVILIGASTGGTRAIQGIVSKLPTELPPVVIVQHLPQEFTKTYSERLRETSRPAVQIARNGEILKQSHVYLARGDTQLRIFREQAIGYRLACGERTKVAGHCPSVEALMQSGATAAGSHAIGVILTGMGSDGSVGLLQIRNAGGRTIAQDEATSVVFGMPKHAFENGGAERLVPLDDIAKTIVALAEERKAASRHREFRACTQCSRLRG